MEEQLERLVNKVWDKYEQTPRAKRLMIAVAGIPGSGKTTLAAALIKRLNARYRETSPGTSQGNLIAAFIPMDGYHLTRAQLSAMPDPVTAHARRGAVFTFDGSAYLALVKRLREPICAETTTLYAPSFDHKIKDPVEGDIAIAKGHRIVVFEGNYCALDLPPWREAAGLMDELWFVDVGFEVAKRRLVARHVRAGISRDEEEAGRRVEGNDLVNGRQICEVRLPIDEMIASVEDEGWSWKRQEDEHDLDPKVQR
ncbi:P-loop containing nucleoside triphosphate hydrolase protein [Patellaria atrata CBS 101060]|uniref:P-loop containing nucleoside triphosphate hydrolase protein n=1 Tax=Patellaria atrata CBS 101060 TaxID=1346257 RepID=A0A9P4SDW5_9PEZI|nr:P-loop containing nucleoside triphosphate hydrolase protein [Patellaria atrata CBS 101060]